MLDLLEAKFNLAGGAAHARYGLLLNLPQFAHRDVRLEQDIFDAAYLLPIFGGIAAQL